MSQFRFSSTIRIEYHDALERLFFFSPQQNRYYDRIIEIVEKFGKPIIINNGKTLSMKVEGNIDSNCIFASHGPKLVGVLIYAKNTSKNIQLLHISIDEDYTSKGNFANMILASKMVDKLKEIARNIKGIETITIGYCNSVLFVSDIPRKKAI